MDLQKAVVQHGADLGLAFDGDADRCFVVDEKGAIVSPSTLTALIAARELAKHPGSPVIHNLITSRAVPEVVREHGGVPVRTKVGHSFIKQQMLETGAIFGGEHSAHYYFLRNFRADSGLIASMLMLDEVSRSGTDLSVLRKPFERYAASGEINTAVDDPAAVIELVAAAFPGLPQDRLDGLTVDLGDWWFNLRPSTTDDDRYFPTPPEVPTGLPSALLERRPDIRQSENVLIGANARLQNYANDSNRKKNDSVRSKPDDRRRRNGGGERNRDAARASPPAAEAVDTNRIRGLPLCPEPALMARGGPDSVRM